MEYRLLESTPCVVFEQPVVGRENLTEDRPFSIVADLAEMYGAFDKVRTAAGTDGLIVPGHDPLMMRKHEAQEGLEGVALKIA